jgi:hypothetical protein
MMRRLASLYVILVFSFSGALQAQTTNATVTGRVTDPTKAVVPGAKVTLTNMGTNFQYQGTTNDTGSYYVTNLLPGSYRMEVEKIGLTTVIKPDIVLHVQDALEINFEMAIGSQTERITVEAGAPTVQLATSTISAVVDSTAVRELPLNGRSWTDLVLLQPGVAQIQTLAPFTSGAKRGRRGFGNEMAVGGSRPTQNNYRLDGISINDYSNGAPGSVLGGQLGVDAIQEFSVLTSNYSTEYGRTSGGVVNAITRSGTNQFHGGVYEFLRNDALDARNFFDGAQIPPFRRNQFGADAGGPIRKDKVFVFGDYEGIRQSKGITNVATVPSPAARSGTLCSAPDTTPACSPTTITVDPSVQKYLPFWSLPNGGIKAGSNGDIGIFTFAGQQGVSENFFTTRVDSKISDKDSLAATYLSDIAPYNQPDGLNDVLLTSKSNRQFVTLQETHIFSPTLVNSARIGYNRYSTVVNTALTAINPLVKDSSLAAIPGQFASQVKVSGLKDFTGGVRGNSFSQFYWNSFQEYDDAFWTHGTHSLKFGGGVERMQFNSHAPSDPSGAFSFGSLRNFLTNRPESFAAGLSRPIPVFGYRQTILGVYIQDDWRARRDLTVNMGLRWEMITVPTEVHNMTANLLTLTDPTPHLGPPLISNNSLRNFEPRVGFAWDPFHNGKTALRGGFGIYDVLIMTSQFEEGFPFEQDGAASNLPAGSFYTGGLALLTASTARAFYAEQHPHRSYAMQWNLNVQRELVPSLTASVGYIGSRAVHLVFAIDDANIVVPKRIPQGYLFPSPVGSGTKINPNFGEIIGRFYGNRSTYDGLQVTVQKAMRRGVQLQGSFTWGRGIDSSSANVRGNQFLNSVSSLPWYDLKLARGPTDFNIARTLVINGTWQVPSPKSFSGPAAWITNGWELGGILTVSDGVPFTATWGTDGDPQGLNSTDNWAFPNRLTGPGCGTLINPGNPNNYIKTQCFTVPTAPSAAFYTANCDSALGTFPQCFNLRGNAGRNILVGPGTSNLDFSVFKNNYIKRISENFNVQFRAEFFNVLNHANFAVPATPDNTDIFDSSGSPTGVAGLITSTTTTAREIQFALKLIW